MKKRQQQMLWISGILWGVLLVSGAPALSSGSPAGSAEAPSPDPSSDTLLPAPESASEESGQGPVNEKIFVSVSGQLFSVRLKEADLFDVMEALSRKSGMRIKVDKGASKKITLSFRDMPFEKGIRNLIRPLSHAMVWKRGKDKNGKDVDVLEELHVFREGHQGGRTVEFIPDEEPAEAAEPERVEKRRWTEEERARILERLRVSPTAP